jgi:hypothetical protein
MTEPYYGNTAHPNCGPATGHVCAKPSGQICFETGCGEPAGTLWGPLWCPDHDAERIDRISALLAPRRAGFTPVGHTKSAEPLAPHAAGRTEGARS